MLAAVRSCRQFIQHLATLRTRWRECGLWLCLPLRLTARPLPPPHGGAPWLPARRARRTRPASPRRRRRRVFTRGIGACEPTRTYGRVCQTKTGSLYSTSRRSSRAGSDRIERERARKGEGRRGGGENSLSHSHSVLRNEWMRSRVDAHGFVVAVAAIPTSQP